MIFHQHKAIFFHVPRTGGYTIERFLDDENDRDAHIYYPEIVFGLKYNVYTQHLDYERFKKLLEYEKIVDVSVLKKYFKFCFVRNTYDRIISCFFYNSKFNPKNKKTFKKYLKIIKNETHKLYHHGDQLKYVLNKNGEVTVDFIGRYENYQEDMKKVCRILNISYETLPVTNISKREKDYKQYYDEESKNIVYEIYKKEIEYFNFEF